MTDISDSDTKTDKTDSGPDNRVSYTTRRALLAALAGGGVGAAAAAGIAQQSTATPQGQVGSAANPLAAAYIAELRGPIVDQGDVITQLVDTRVAEQGASISPDANTLVFRYDPNSTV